MGYQALGLDSRYTSVIQVNGNTEDSYQQEEDSTYNVDVEPSESSVSHNFSGSTGFFLIDTDQVTKESDSVTLISGAAPDYMEISVSVSDNQYDSGASGGAELTRNGSTVASSADVPWSHTEQVDNPQGDSWSLSVSSNVGNSGTNYDASWDINQFTLPVSDNLNINSVTKL